MSFQEEQQQDEESYKKYLRVVKAHLPQVKGFFVTIFGKPISFNQGKLILQVSETDNETISVVTSQNIDIDQIPFLEIRGRCIEDAVVELHEVIPILDKNFDLEMYNKIMEIGQKNYNDLM